MSMWITRTLSGGLLLSLLAGCSILPKAEVPNVYLLPRWSDRAPSLLRDRLIDTFRADGRVMAVSNDDTNLHADRELDGQLRSFQSEYENGAPVAVVRYDAQLVDAADHRILATKNFEVREPAASKDVPHVVAAFGRASDALAADVVAWSVAR